MTQASTEQPETLRLAVSLEGWYCPPESVLKASADELRRLHARVQELEASQAQRVPLSAKDVAAIADAAGYFSPTVRSHFINGLRHGEQAHGIEQEKQG